MANRLKHPLTMEAQLDMVYKNLRREYRDHMKGCSRNSFKDILRLGRDYEKENKLDERQAQLTGRKAGRVAAITESEAQEKTEAKAIKKEKNKKSKTGESQQEVIVAVNGNRPQPQNRARQMSARKGPQQGSAGQHQPQQRQQLSQLQQQQIQAKFEKATAPDPQALGKFQGNRSGPFRNQNGAAPKRNNQQAENQQPIQSRMQNPQEESDQTTCYRCNEPGHIAAWCPTLTCYRCQGSGHLAKFCSQGVPNMQQQKGDYFCYKCGYQGVTVKNCPKCSLNVQENEDSGA